MSKARLWIIYYCSLEMEADNEPAISLPKLELLWLLVYRYILNESMLYEKTKQKQKGKKQRNKSFQRRESNLGPPRQLILKTSVKLIIFNTLTYETLPVDAVWSR